MLHRTLLSSVIALAVSAPLLFCTSSSAVANEKTSIFHLENTVVLGQSGKSLSGWDKFKQGWNKFFQDDSPDQRHDHRSSLPAQPAIPTQPPKPPTAIEVQQSITMPLQERRAGTVAPTRQENGTGQTSLFLQDGSDESEDEAETSVHERLRKYREPVFSHPAFREAVTHSRERASVTRDTVLAPSPSDVGSHFNNMTDDPGNFADLPAVPPTPTVLEVRQEITSENLQPAPRGDLAVPYQPTEKTASQQAADRIRDQANKQNEQPLGTTTERVVIVSPCIEVEIEKPFRSVTGQEITYKIQVSNTGNAPAERVVLTAEIPSWIDVRQAEGTNGKAVVRQREDGTGNAD